MRSRAETRLTRLEAAVRGAEDRQARRLADLSDAALDRQIAEVGAAFVRGYEAEHGPVTAAPAGLTSQDRFRLRTMPAAELAAYFKRDLLDAGEGV